MVPRDCNKTGYSTYKHAMRAMYDIKHHSHNVTLDAPIRAYRCKYCNLFHITSQELVIKGKVKATRRATKKPSNPNKIEWRY